MEGMLGPLSLLSFQPPSGKQLCSAYTPLLGMSCHGSQNYRPAIVSSHELIITPHKSCLSQESFIVMENTLERAHGNPVRQGAVLHPKFGDVLRYLYPIICRPIIISN